MVPVRPMETAASEPLTLRAADGIGVFVSAELAGSLLYLCLSDGRRGRAHVLVYDTAREFRVVARFAAPSRSRSGATRLAATADIVVASDDYSVVAFDVRSGQKLWERTFEHPIDLCGAYEAEGHLLFGGTQGRGSFVLSLFDGATTLERPWLTSLSNFGAVNIGPRREIAHAVGSSLTVTPEDGAPIKIATPHLTRGVGCFDATSAHFAAGAGDGTVFVADIAARTATTTMKLPEGVATVGWLGDGALWALGRAGHLRVTGRAGDVELEVDLGCETLGGVLDAGRTFAGLAHTETRTFHVHALPSKAEIFATKAGFGCMSVALGADGALYVAGENAVVRIDASSCAITKAATGNLRLRALEGGGVVGGSLGSVALIPRGGAKARRLGLALNGHQLSRGGEKLAIVNGMQVKIYATSSGDEIDRWDLRRSWIAEAGETIDAVFFGPAGDLFIVVSDTDVYARARFDAGPVHRFAGAARLVPAPDGASLFRVTTRQVERIHLDDWTTTPLATTCLPADLVTATPSPSGRHIALHHRDGRFAVVDVDRATVTAVASDAGSGAELASHELYEIDLVEPPTCAFSADEQRVMVPSNGRLLFADVATGAVVGELAVSTDGKSCVVTDGAALAWTPGKRGSKAASRPTEEIWVTRSGVRLEGAALDALHQPDLLRRLV